MAHEISLGAGWVKVPTRRDADDGVISKVEVSVDISRLSSRSEVLGIYYLFTNCTIKNKIT
jgi:hypothetical protein